MLVIRLARIGRKNAAKFRIVLQEKTQAPKSAAQEILGAYDPHAKDRTNQITLEADRIKYWLSQGAQPSATVHNMLVEFGIIEAKKRRVVGLNKKSKAQEAEAAAAAEEAAKKAAEEKAAAPAEAAPAETAPTEETKEAAA